VDQHPHQPAAGDVGSSFRSRTRSLVIIHIKVEGSQEAEVDYSPSDDYGIFKSDCIVEIQRKWLASEFFQAPMKRWKFDEKSQSRLTLLVPKGCVASEGARLLKLRLGFEYTRKIRNPASTALERTWSPVDWWKATSGRVSSLFGALHLFHFTLQKDFAIEVAETLKLYRLRCPSWVVAIAQDLKIEVVEPLVKVEPLDVPFDTFTKLLSNALTYDSNNDYKSLVQRALAGRSYSPENIAKGLIQAWFSLFHWNAAIQTVTDYQAPQIPTIGELIRENESLPWLLQLVEELVGEQPEMACTFLMALFSRMKDMDVSYTFSRKNTGSGNITTEKTRVFLCNEHLAELEASCAHSLFVKAGLQWSDTQAAFDNFSNLSCKTTRYTFKDQRAGRPNFIDPKVFAALPSEAQKVWFEASSPACVTLFRDHAHILSPLVRGFLLGNAPLLSDKDIKFLTAAPQSMHALEVDEHSNAAPKRERQRQS